MRNIALIAGTLMAAGSLFAADQQLLNLVMPEARIMAGVNVTTAKISPFGQFVLARIAAGSNAGKDSLQQFIQETGFDPRADVTEVLVASAGDPNSPSGLLLARGSFDVSRLSNMAAMHGKSASLSTYAGATLFTAEAPASADGAAAKPAHGLAFIGNSIAVVGDLASVKAALDRAGGVNSVDPALAARVQALSATTDAWTVSLASMASLIPSGLAPGNSTAAQSLQMVKNVLSSSGGVKLGTDIQLIGQAVLTDAASAKSMADLVRMAGALVTMGAAQNPQMAAAAQLIQNLKVSEEGANLNLSLTVPESQVETLMQASAGPQAKPAERHKL